MEGRKEGSEVRDKCCIRAKHPAIWSRTLGLRSGNPIQTFHMRNDKESNEPRGVGSWGS